MRPIASNMKIITDPLLASDALIFLMMCTHILTHLCLYLLNIWDIYVYIHFKRITPVRPCSGASSPLRQVLGIIATLTFPLNETLE